MYHLADIDSQLIYSIMVDVCPVALEKAPHSDEIDTMEPIMFRLWLASVYADLHPLDKHEITVRARAL